MNSQSHLLRLHCQTVLQIVLLTCFALSVTSCATRAANTGPEQRERERQGLQAHAESIEVRLS